MSKRITLDNLKTIIEESDDRYVRQRRGYGLSSNDFEDEYKERIRSVEDNAEMNRISAIKLENVTLKPDEQRVVNIHLPEATKDEMDEILNIKTENPDDKDEDQYATVKDIQALFGNAG